MPASPRMSSCLRSRVPCCCELLQHSQTQALETAVSRCAFCHRWHAAWICQVAARVPCPTAEPTIPITSATAAACCFHCLCWACNAQHSVYSSQLAAKRWTRQGPGVHPLAVSKAPDMHGAHLLGHAEGTPPGALTPLGVPLGWSLPSHVVAGRRHPEAEPVS